MKYVVILAQVAQSQNVEQKKNIQQTDVWSHEI